MNFLEERILREGRVLPGGVLKVVGYVLSICHGNDR